VVIVAGSCLESKKKNNFVRVRITGVTGEGAEAVEILNTKL
jgi:hypothetical protein